LAFGCCAAGDVIFPPTVPPSFSFSLRSFIVNGIDDDDEDDSEDDDDDEEDDDEDDSGGRGDEAVAIACRAAAFCVARAINARSSSISLLSSLSLLSLSGLLAFNDDDDAEAAGYDNDGDDADDDNVGMIVDVVVVVVVTEGGGVRGMFVDPANDDDEEDRGASFVTVTLRLAAAADDADGAASGESRGESTSARPLRVFDTYDMTGYYCSFVSREKRRVCDDEIDEMYCLYYVIGDRE
jgi:hypothetical protein